MPIWGLTGGIASGKSTVAEFFRRSGAPLVDADATYHALIAPRGGVPSPLAQAIDAAFPGSLAASGALDRARLGAAVFADPQARARLEAVTHPAVRADSQRQLDALRAAGHPVALHDIPLLYERDLAAQCHGVIVVWVPAELQLARLRARSGLGEAEARARLAAQLPIDDKRARADCVVDNSGPLAATEQQVERLWARLRGPLSA